MNDLRVSLTKGVQDLFPENYKVLLRQMKGLICHVHESEDIIFLRCLFSPNRCEDSVW